MKIDRLINNIYYKDFLNNIYGYRTTDAHFHFDKSKPLSELVSMLVLCSVSEVNFMMAEQKELEELLSSQEMLHIVESEMIFYIHNRYMKKKAEQVSKANGPTKMSMRIDDSPAQKLETIGLPDYLQNRNLDILIIRAKELLS